MTNRRVFLQAGGVACFAAGAAKPFRLGLVTRVRDPQADLAKVQGLGLPTCFIYTDDYRPALATEVRSALDRYRIEVTGVESLGPGETVWDFTKGPLTIGLVPRRYRRQRLDALKRASDWGKLLDSPCLQTHCGFIPEDPNDPLYDETVQAVRELASHCQGNQQSFVFETGQETPVTLSRTIQDVGMNNVGVGLDTGNLILYGKANPADAVEVLGKYVRTVHAKDGLYPTDPRKLGTEVPIGEGRVDFRRVLAGLRQCGYAGALTIEREVSGPRQAEDVRRAKAYLEKLMAEVAS